MFLCKCRSWLTKCYLYTSVPLASVWAKAYLDRVDVHFFKTTNLVYFVGYFADFLLPLQMSVTSEGPWVVVSGFRQMIHCDVNTEGHRQRLKSLCVWTLALSILKWKWLAWMSSWHCASHRRALISSRFCVTILSVYIWMLKGLLLIFVPQFNFAISLWLWWLTTFWQRGKW